MALISATPAAAQIRALTNVVVLDANTRVVGTVIGFMTQNRSVKAYRTPVTNGVRVAVVVEGKGFEGRDPKCLENLRDAIVRNAANDRCKQS